MNRFERFLFRIIGPAQVGPRTEQPAPAPRHRDLVPGGYERRGTPGNYYIVAKPDLQED